MNPVGPFTPGDLAELDYLYRKADRVIAMVDVFNGDTDPMALAVRHDVDDNPGSLDTALRMAEWEHDHGYRTTYYLLHDSYYWRDAPDAARELEAFGHEVGLHVNAIGVALKTGRDPHLVLASALIDLRRTADVIGMVAHGDQPICGQARFVNDELFHECQRPSYGLPTRVLRHGTHALRLEPVPMRHYGLLYDANWIGRGDYLSDSGCEWSKSFGETADAWPDRGQLHMLVHPDWWRQAFVPQKVAAA